MVEAEKSQAGSGEAPRRRSDTSKASPSSSTSRSGSPAAAFAFWGYFTIAVSLITLLFIFLPRIERTDERSWFLSLPEDLRRHYSAGKLVKVQPPGGSLPFQVFAVELGPRDAETVLLLHGLGCSSFSYRHVLRLLSAGGFRAVAVDLPGSGFSDEALWEEIGESSSPLGWIWGIYGEIKEKGLFWGFDQLIETGEIREKPARVSAGEGFGWILGQVTDSMGLTPVHLVLHDSALTAVSSWVSAYAGSVSSVSIVDSSPISAAFPSPLLRVPVLGRFLLGSKAVFVGLLRLCCARSLEGLDAEAYRLMLKGRKGRNPLAAAARALNHSFDLREWADSEEVKDLPLQVLWSNTLSDRWIDEGRRVAGLIHRAKFTFHSGGRWPQEDAAEEISAIIAEFVSSLPTTVRRMEEDIVPEHIQKMFDEASHDEHYHHHHHHHHHGHEMDYMGMHGHVHGW